MRRDLVFILLFLGVAIAIFAWFFRIEEPPNSPPGSTDPAATGTAASGTAATEPPLRIVRSDGTVRDPGSPGSKEDMENATELNPPGERAGGGSSGDAGLDFVLEEVKFDDVELGEVLEYLGKEAGLKFDVNADLLTGDEAKVSLAASKLSVRNCLELILLTKGLAWEVTSGGTIRITDGD